MRDSLKSHTLIVANDSLIVRHLEGRTALFERTSKQCYRLDPVGSRIFSILQRPMTFAEVVEVLLQEYDVDRSRCESDLMSWILELAGAGLIEVENETRNTEGGARHVGSGQLRD